MSSFVKVIVVAAVIAFHAIGCLASAEPTPMPTATPDVLAMVKAAIDAALDGTPTPTPTPDIQAMVEAAVNATFVAAATPAPTYTPRPTPTPRPISVPTLIPTIPLAPTPLPTVIYMTVQPPRVTVVLSTPTPVPRRLQAVECGPPCHSDSEPIFPPVDWISPPKISENGVIELVAVLDDGVDMGALGTEDGGHFTVTDSNNILYGTIEPPTPPGWEWDPQPGLWVAERFDYVANTLRVRAQIDPAGATHPGLRLCLWGGGADGERSVLDCVRVRQP